MKPIQFVLVASALISVSSTSAVGQSDKVQEAQRGWAQTSEPIRACINTMFATKNLSVDQLIAAGIGPTDKRMAQLIISCNQILSAQLKSNIPCTVTNSMGQQVQSTCNQVFAKDENGTVSEISRDQFIRAVGNGEKVQIATLETLAANESRIAAEHQTRMIVKPKPPSTGSTQVQTSTPQIRRPPLPKVGPNNSVSGDPRTIFTKSAPPMAQAMKTNVKGASSIETCRLIHKISFTSDGYKIVSQPPSSIARFALIAARGQSYVQFIDGTVVRSPKYESVNNTTIKGFGDYPFLETKYKSYNTEVKAPMKDVIGDIEISKTFESGASAKIGMSSVVIFSVRGEVNGINLDIERSNPYSFSPLNILFKTKLSDSWEHFVGACRLTYVG